jgi:hypothetical protein
MAAKKKRVDPIKQRERRAKMAAIVGAVLFLALAAYEVPSMMKLMNQKPPPGAYPTAPEGGSPTTTTSSSTVDATGGLADTDQPPTGSDANSLVSFSQFQTKNPLTTPAATPAPTPAATAAAASSTASTAAKLGAAIAGLSAPAATGGAGANGKSTTSVVPSTTTPSSTTPTTTTPATAPAVAISVNGTVSRVSSGGTFPASAPVFRLASYTKGSAQIAIVGGTYATGDGTLKLVEGQKITLENQTTGTKYVVELLSTP